MSKKLFSLAKAPIGDLIIGIAFGKLSKLLPVKRIEETEKVIAFWHPKPFWEKHILIVPKRQIKSLASLNDDDLEYVEEVYRVAIKIVKKLNWEKDGYTIMTNGGNRQEVNQLRFHLSAGDQL